MSANTKIEWADSTWSPWRGCTKVSAGCANCYAETLSKRNPAVLGQWGKGKPRVLAKNWNDPVKWNRTKICTNCDTANPLDALTCRGASCGHFEFRRPRVFPSLCDWLDDEVHIEWLARFLKLVHDTPNLDWLLLTKRPENWHSRISQAADHPTVRGKHDRWMFDWCVAGITPPNVWVGTSVEDQPNADQRIPALLKIPARLRFLSVEPMLGPVDLAYTCFNGSDSFGSMPGIGWVIVGGESGPGARPCNVDWVRSVVRQCSASKVACFVKQLGADPFFDPPSMDFSQIGMGVRKLNHPKGGDPAEWPESLRVRQMPEVHP